MDWGGLSTVMEDWCESGDATNQASVDGQQFSPPVSESGSK